MNSKHKLATSVPNEFIPNCSEANKLDNMSAGIVTIFCGQISQAKVMSL